MEPIDYWRFNEDFTVIQAVLLTLNHDPTDLQEEVLQCNPFYTPVGFDATFAAVTASIMNGKLKANIYKTDGGDPIWHMTFVNVDDLKEWLLQKQFKSEFFFGKQVNTQDISTTDNCERVIEDEIIYNETVTKLQQLHKAKFAIKRQII